MTGIAASAALLAVFVAAPPAISAPLNNQQQNAPKQQDAPKKDAAPAPSSLTGCVDEQNASYVLIDDKELKPIANLTADGFPQEGFAKYLGQKVTVRGTSSPGDPRPTFKVRSITAVSETCAPQR